jgi:predicted nucleic acid-binding protein
VDAFDADVLIYAAVPDHELGRRVVALFSTNPLGVEDPPDGVGSLLLLPEVLGKPLRDGRSDEVRALVALLGRLDLRPLDRHTAELATSLCRSYRLHAADATHLATAIVVGADRFITNSRRDFPATIAEVQITYPSELPEP